MQVFGKVKFFNEAKGYPTQPVTNNPISRNVAADPVNTPIIFEPPVSLASTPQVWMAVSGGSAGVADPNWGGCLVWLSFDGSSYSQIGTISAPACMGATTASLPSFGGTNPDSTDTLSVNLTESNGTLASVSAIAASLGVTLCLVDDELLAFETATLSSANHYALTTLYRGLYGTPIGSHSAGTSFAYLANNAILIYDLPPQYPAALFFKFQSFNVFGGGVQDLSSCVAYGFVVPGPWQYTYPYLGF